MNRKFLATAVAAFAIAAATSARAVVTHYEANLDGLTESPPNASPGTGFGTFAYDDAAHTLSLDFDFTGLLGTTTAAHLHGPTAVPGAGTAGVMTTTPLFAGFPTGVTSGSYSNVLDLTASSSYNPSFVTANGGTIASAEAALLAAINGGQSYLNIHTTVFGGGEIRGFLVRVPEPGSLLLAATGLAGFVIRRRFVG
ncbi:MAG: CHRD domain-containing protein [Planctomycetales bacterium]|nr:CHRD domain-containing protein [Planctomycetales bacterium]